MADKLEEVGAVADISAGIDHGVEGVQAEQEPVGHRAGLVGIDRPEVRPADVLPEIVEEVGAKVEIRGGEGQSAELLADGELVLVGARGRDGPELGRGDIRAKCIEDRRSVGEIRRREGEGVVGGAPKPKRSTTAGRAVCGATGVAIVSRNESPLTASWRME